MKNLAYYDGKFGEIEEISVPFADRSHFFGDGIYDATYSRNYKIFALNDHLDRFYKSAELLEIELPYTKDKMAELLYAMLGRMDSDENFVYFQATRAHGGVRNHVFPEGGEKAKIWINIFEKKIADLTKKVKLITMEDTRHHHCNIKTINLFPAVIASQRAKEAGAFETVLHRQDRVTECAHSNVHIIKEGRFITAPTDELILPGIARKHLIAACGRLGIQVVERPFSLEELFSADEVIVSSAGVLGIGAFEIDGVEVGGKATDILKKLQSEVLREFAEQTK